jgi:hypothetical protein
MTVALVEHRSLIEVDARKVDDLDKLKTVILCNVLEEIQRLSPNCGLDVSSARTPGNET